MQQIQLNEMMGAGDGGQGGSGPIVRPFWPSIIYLDTNKQTVIFILMHDYLNIK